MDFPTGKIVTVISGGTTEDEYGDSSGSPSETSWGPCAVAPRFSTERTDPHAPAVVVGKTIYGPTRTFRADDRLRIDGIVYEIDGLPGDWESPFTGWAPGTEVAVKRASGF